jgi:hypothetical protein
MNFSSASMRASLAGCLHAESSASDAEKPGTPPMVSGTEAETNQGISAATGGDDIWMKIMSISTHNNTTRGQEQKYVTRYD